jgi:ABC-2 type transport system ATP-binding protein
VSAVGERRGLELVEVAKRYGARTALDGVTLAVPPGSVLALLGPNGAGKTTLTSIAAGLLAPDAGTARVDGVDLRRAGPGARRLVGLAPQEIGVYPTLTVAQNLCFFAELAGARPRAARRQANEVAGRLLLDHLLGRRAGELSGGEKRRLHTAIALVHRPPLVLLDEPTAGADVEARTAILRAVRALAAEGASVLYTTHYLPEVEELDAEVAVLRAGQVVATGTVADLVAAHTHARLVLTCSRPDVADPARWLDRWPGATSDEPGTLSLPCPDPASALPAALAQLGADVAHLVGVDVVRPSLDVAYRQLMADGSGAAA